MVSVVMASRVKASGAMISSAMISGAMISSAMIKWSLVLTSCSRLGSCRRCTAAPSSAEPVVSSAAMPASAAAAAAATPAAARPRPRPRPPAAPRPPPPRAAAAPAGAGLQTAARRTRSFVVSSRLAGRCEASSSRAALREVASQPRRFSRTSLAMCTTCGTSRARASAASRLDAVKASSGSSAERASSQTETASASSPSDTHASVRAGSPKLPKLATRPACRAASYTAYALRPRHCLALALHMSARGCSTLYPSVRSDATSASAPPRPAGSRKRAKTCRGVGCGVHYYE